MGLDIPSLDDWHDQELAGQRVLLRADLNLPLHDGVVSDYSRLERIVPTVQALRLRGARIGVLSHFGRPRGQRHPQYSLAMLADVLAAAIGEGQVTFAADCVGPPAVAAMAALGDGDVALFENLRFHPGEEANDSDFAAALAAQGDLYVNDAFSCAHRAHASITGLPQRLPSVMGYAMAGELAALENVLESPTRPAAALIGGAKISTKLALLGALITQIDLLVIGGGMANTFLQARGLAIGRSLSEANLISVASDILEQAARVGCEVILPLDGVVAPALAPGVESRVVAISAVPDDMMLVDIGPQGVAAIKERLDSCRTLLWNGPLGAFETPPFDQATTQIARHVAHLTKQGQLISVAGGGDTAAALAGSSKDFTYISAAGGAFLEWLEGKKLPGITALRHS